MLWKPDQFVRLLQFSEPTPDSWVQVLAIAIIFLTFAYIPSAIAPLRARSTNFFIIAGPVIPIILLFWIGGGTS